MPRPSTTRVSFRWRSMTAGESFGRPRREDLIAFSKSPFRSQRVARSAARHSTRYSSQRLTDDELLNQPLAGALLAFDMEARGLPEPAFRTVR